MARPPPPPKPGARPTTNCTSKRVGCLRSCLASTANFSASRGSEPNVLGRAAPRDVRRFRAASLSTDSLPYRQCQHAIGWSVTYTANENIDIITAPYPHPIYPTQEPFHICGSTDTVTNTNQSPRCLKPQCTFGSLQFVANQIQ